MCPETNEHRRIKEIVLSKLKDLYGAGLKEYPDSGQINDVYIITPNQIEIFVENIWTSTKNNFQRDLNILHRSSANVKILIVNPDILKNDSLVREFEKTRMAERKRGIAISDMIDGSRILAEPKFVDKEFVEIVEKFVKEFKEVKDPISVSPETIIVGRGNWQTYSLFKVYNKTDEIYYQIWIKLTIDTLNILTQNIEIDLPKPKEEFGMQIADIRISCDIVRYNGIDQTGNKAIFLLLSSLNPKEVLSFVLTDKNPSLSSILSQNKVAIRVCGFSKEPSIIISRQGRAGLSFKPPEKFTLQDIVFLIKKDQKRS